MNDGEDQSDRSCEKRRCITMSWGGKALHNTTKANWTGHILHRNCLVNYVIVGTIREDGTTRQKTYTATE